MPGRQKNDPFVQVHDSGRREADSKLLRNKSFFAGKNLAEK